MLTCNAIGFRDSVFSAMPHWDLLLTDARIASMREGAAAYGAVDDGALAIADGRIAWLGRSGDLPDSPAANRR